MPYTTLADVRRVMPSAAQIADDDVTAFITSTELLMDELLANSGYSDERLKLISTYLTAHYIQVSHENGGITRSRTGNSEESYANENGDKLGIANTLFGQQALSFDTKGNLAPLASKTLKASFRIV